MFSKLLLVGLIATVAAEDPAGSTADAAVSGSGEAAVVPTGYCSWSSKRPSAMQLMFLPGGAACSVGELAGKVAWAMQDSEEDWEGKDVYDGRDQCPRCMMGEAYCSNGVACSILPWSSTEGFCHNSQANCESCNWPERQMKGVWCSYSVTGSSSGAGSTFATMSAVIVVVAAALLF